MKTITATEIHNTYCAVPHSHQRRYVREEVAQGLYEALSMIAYQGMDARQCQIYAEQALAAADGDET